MVRVGLAVVLGDVRRLPKMPGVGGRLNCCPECLEAKVIRGEAPTSSLRSMELRLSMAPGLDDVAIVADPMAREGTPRRKVTPSLLSRPSASSLWLVRAVARGVAVASPRWWGVSIGAARHQDAKLSTYCLRAMQSYHFASFSRSLVFGSGVSEMSSRQQAEAAMFYAMRGK